MIEEGETSCDTKWGLNGENFPVENHEEKHWQLENSGERLELFHVVAQVTKPELRQRINIARVSGVNTRVNVWIGGKDVLWGYHHLFI